jgi:type IX secretion system PorP/SprF family membrane protein
MSIQVTKILLPLFVVLRLAILTTCCQELHYSNLHENLFKLNPSRITHSEDLTFHLTYRNQWPGTSDFITYDGDIFYSSDRLKSTGGIHVSNDNQGGGIINLTTFSLLYGYKTKIGRYIDFSAGLGGSYNIYSVNISSLQFENMGSGSVPSDEDNDFFDFSAGIEFGFNDHSWFGASVSHITNIAAAKHLNAGRKFNFSYTGRYHMNASYAEKNIFAEPLMAVSVQNNFSELVYGGRIFYKIIYGGVYLRQDIRFQMDALIVLLGTSFKNWSFFYTYDINLSGADSRFSKLAAHEVTFLYQLEYKRNSNKKSSKKRAIKCPKI